MDKINGRQTELRGIPSPPTSDAIVGNLISGKRQSKLILSIQSVIYSVTNPLVPDINM